MRIDLSLVFPGAELALERHLPLSPERGKAAPLPSSLPAGTTAVPSAAAAALSPRHWDEHVLVGPPSRETHRHTVQGPMSSWEGGSEMLLPPAPLPAVTHLSVASHPPFSFNLLGFAFSSTQGKCCFFPPPPLLFFNHSEEGLAFKGWFLYLLITAGAL